MRAIFAAGVVLSLVACGGPKNGDDDGNGDGGTGPDACVGLQCAVVNCGAMGLPPTTLTGTVFAPNGTLPLYNINVYVPVETPLPPFVDGVKCDRCSDALPGGPIARAVTDEAGNFRIENVPAGADIPLVITTGKWRRQITIPAVNQCTDNAIAPTETRLPKNSTEGDLPRIAITTGDADALECLVRKLGIDDAEMGKDGGPQKLHLYAGETSAANKFAGGFPGGAGDFPAGTTLWSSLDKLKNYDLVIFSCEGSQNVGTKPQTSLDSVKEYAALGGRVFLSHWHNVWVSGNQNGGTPAIPEWKPLGMWSFGNGTFSADGVVDEVRGGGAAFATWLMNVSASTTRGRIPITMGKTTLTSIDTTMADRWVYLDQQISGRTGVQNFQFTTPVNVASDQRCGKVVFSDMHVSAGSTSRSATPFPGGCAAGDLTPQEKALAFMFFDIASCVGAIF